MKTTTITLLLALPVLAGCAHTPHAPICSVSKSVPGCQAKYYKFKESSDYTLDAAFGVCEAKAVAESRVAGEGMLYFSFHKACMTELGFLPCEQGGQNLPECQ